MKANKHRKCNGYKRMSRLNKNFLLLNVDFITLSRYPADITNPLRSIKKDTPHEPPATNNYMPFTL